MLQRTVFILCSLIITSCSLLKKEETKVYERNKIPKWQIDQIQTLNTDFKIDENTVFIDTRKAFSYSLSHIESAININHEDFQQKREHLNGMLDDRFYFHARRLSRYGIDIDTPVLVLGNGSAGHAEEAWLAWYFSYLGIKNVGFSLESLVKAKRNSDLPPPVDSKRPWKPQFQSNLRMDQKGLAKIIKLNKKEKSGYLVIDVLTDKEFYSGKSELWSKYDLKFIHIPWTEFFDDQFKPNKDIFTKLVSVGFHPSKKIIVVSNKGQRSAAVTMALQKLGFVESANFHPGYEYLNSKYWK